MSKKLTYHYQGQQLTVPQIHGLYGKKRCGETWLRQQLKAHSVEDVMKLLPDSFAEVSKKGRKRTPWGKSNPCIPSKEKEAQSKEQRRLYMQERGIT